MTMKVLAVCGSPNKKKSTTEFALNKALEVCKEAGLETEMIRLCDYDFSGCIDCKTCKNKLTCSINDDFKNHILPKLDDDNIKGFLFGSPVYIGGMSSQLKMFFDRCLPFRRNGFRFENKIAAAVTVGGSRNGGQELVAIDIIKSCFIYSMIAVPDASPTSHYGANLWGRHPEGIEADETGITTAINTGKKVAEIVKKMNNY